MHGEGILKLPNGEIYKGSYVEDKKEGHGVFLWPNGKCYDGGWKNGKQHGVGTFTDSKKGIKKRGLWEQGQRVQWID